MHYVGLEMPLRKHADLKGVPVMHACSTWKVCNTGAYDQGLPSGMFHQCWTDWCIACMAKAEQN